MVALVAPFPDAVVSHPIGAGHVIDEVLEEIALRAGLNDHQPRAGELGQLQQKQGRGIELQMAPAVVGHHRIAGGRIEFGVDGVEPLEARLEALHLRRLAHHRAHQSPHQLQDPLLQLEGAAAGPLQPPVGQGQSPDALDGIDAVPHPGVAVVAVHGAGGAGGKQTRDRMLPAQDHVLDLAVQPVEQLAGLLPPDVASARHGDHVRVRTGRAGGRCCEARP